jgi:hypothetical protein
VVWFKRSLGCIQEYSCPKRVANPGRQEHSTDVKERARELNGSVVVYPSGRVVGDKADAYLRIYGRLESKAPLFKPPH